MAARDLLRLERLPHRAQSRLVADGGKLRKRRAIQARGQLAEIDVGGEGRAARHAAQQRERERGGRRRHLHVHIQPARPQQRCVERRWRRGGGEEDEGRASCSGDAVQLDEHEGEESVERLLARRVLPARRRERLHLVEEEEAGRRRARGREEAREAPLRLADHGGHDLRRVNLDEVGARGRREQPRQARLAAPGRAMHQHATWRPYAKPGKRVEAAQRREDSRRQLRPRR
mmetsp:Transcript_30747/g.102790  ORF Transcript_30747/g.102790 Transcript_30747/m.102790 type:complete len:231 (-) Transcript_30747:212-904(-)